MPTRTEVVRRAGVLIYYKECVERIRIWLLLLCLWLPRVVKLVEYELN